MRRRSSRRRLAAVATVLTLALAGVGVPGVAAAAPVPSQQPTDLMLLVDGSLSLTDTDWQVQLEGFARAVEDPLIFPRSDRVAVGVVQYSGSDVAKGTRLEIPLTRLTDEDAVTDFATRLRAIKRLDDLSNPGDAIHAGADHLAAAGRSGTTWSMCMSTDGEPNAGEGLADAVTYAKNKGVDRYSVLALTSTVFTEERARAVYGPHVFGGGRVNAARSIAEFSSLISGCLNYALDLAAIEVNQAVQDWQNSVPLIRAKSTIVRTFFKTVDSQEVRTSGRLRGYRDGQELPGSPLTPIDSTEIVVGPDPAAGRERFSGSLNFALPVGWTSGRVKLVPDLPGGVRCEGGRWTADCGTEVEFRPGGRLRVNLFAASWTENGAVQEPTFADLFEQYRRMHDVFPVSNATASFQTLDLDERPEDGDDGLEDVNDRLWIDWWSNFRSGQLDPRTMYHAALLGDSGGGLAAGIGSPVSSGWLSGAQGLYGTGYARNRGAHEVAHSLGREHTVNADRNGRTFPFVGAKRGWCGEVAGTFTDDYPHWTGTSQGDRPTLGPNGDRDREIWGVSARYFGDREGLAITSPHATYPMMSYCNSTRADSQGRWIDARDYRALFEGRLSPDATGAISSGAPAAAAPAAADPASVVLRGRVDTAAGTAAFRPTMPAFGAPVATDDPEGGYELRVLDADEQVLHRVRFQPRLPEGTDEPPGGDGRDESTVGTFELAVPAVPESAARAVVVHDGRVIGTLTAERKKPTAARPAAAVDRDGNTVRLSWKGKHAGPHAPTYTAQYSADGGGSWRTYAADSGATEATVPRWIVPGSPAALVRVIASHGLDAAVVASEPFAMPDAPPQLAIRNPAAGAAYHGTQAIRLDAGAYDAETGLLDDGDVTWRSDRDGALGTGQLLLTRADQLSEGAHRISATVTDPAGQTVTREITISISRLPAPTPRYEFGGFRPPIDPDGLTVVEAGRTIPVKWTVGGEKPGESAVASATFDSPGADYRWISTLGSYHLNVDTPRSWAGSRHRLTVTLTDGTQHSTEFEFK
ncbi:PxKF domain-containing protein [Micromonospora sp. NPDC047740]|uniref:PxKF domain-containing protein n=1 Tax=Micromonospora sp. NPDC047740 TaxID=3364254 RepID=UPI003722FE46